MKINCSCGTQLSNVSAVETNGYLVSDAFMETIDYETVEDMDLLIIQKCPDFMKCWQCGDLWVADGPDKRSGTWYTPTGRESKE